MMIVRQTSHESAIRADGEKWRSVLGAAKFLAGLVRGTPLGAFLPAGPCPCACWCLLVHAVDLWWMKEWGRRAPVALL